MADCHTAIQKITFDISDEQITKVKVEIKSWGDCPIQVKNVYEKVFPARFSIIDIVTMEGGTTDFLYW